MKKKTEAKRSTCESSPSWSVREFKRTSGLETQLRTFHFIKPLDPFLSHYMPI